MSASDRVLCVAPLAHVTGLVQGFGLSATGGVPILLTHRFDPAVIATVVRQQQATVTISAPAALYRLVDDEAVTREDLASLRAVFAGGAALSPQLIERFGDRFGIYIHHIYGLTEAASPCHAVPFGATAPIDRKLGTVSIGVPMPNTDARVLGEDGCALGPDEVGQLQITGPGMFAGYWEDPVATAATIEDGWLDTGDVGYYDAEGWFFLVGRRGDIINVAGYKVWPPEVESVLMEHDAVVEAVVVGFPDQTRGSSVGAAISTRSPVTIAELEEHCIQRLAPYKRPRRVAMFSEIPRNPNGKIQRAEIAELLGHGVNE
jgi:long-chain acyl-CoA synthetase